MTNYYEIALPVLVKAVGLTDQNKISSTLATYIGELRLLADGRVQTMDDLVIKDEEDDDFVEDKVYKEYEETEYYDYPYNEKECVEEEFSEEDDEVYEKSGSSEEQEKEEETDPILSLIEPELETAVSNLAYSAYQDLSTGFSSNTTTTTLSKTSLANLVIASHNAYVPKKVSDMIKATLLETYAIAKVLREDKDVFTSSIAESDISRLVGNIRWITYQLSLVKGYNLDVIASFRWLERTYKYIEKSETLYSSAVTKVLSDFNKAKGGTS